MKQSTCASPVASLRPVMVIEFDSNKDSPTYGKYVDAREAVFHCFGSDYEEFESGPANYSTAIVETPDGCVHGLPLRLIRFLDRGEG